MSDGDDEKCWSCQHTRSQHTRSQYKPDCLCGCYGFFPAGAKYCENPKCQGSGCTSNRPPPPHPGGIPAMSTKTLTETVTVIREVPKRIQDLVFFAKDMRRTEGQLARPLTDEELVRLAGEFWERQHGED